MFVDDVAVARSPLQRDGDDWTGDVADGVTYGLVADGHGPGFDPSKVLLDPRALEVHLPSGLDRALARRRGEPNEGRGPLAVARSTPAPRGTSRRSERPPCVVELHVDGYTRRTGGDAPGTFRALVAELPRLRDLGATVVELMPVQQSDPREGSYWGYMPLAVGAVERRYAVGPDAAGELAELVAAAHELDLEVWLDVVFNHTTEVDAGGPTYSLRGLCDEEAYRHDGHGAYVQSSGCGNDLDVRSPFVADLVVWALDRLADLGVDGFRFDLAAVLTHDDGFVARLDSWAAQRGVRMIAEPWDAAGRYQLGRGWPGTGWLQWNDRFREDGRGFLRGEEGLVATMQQRLQGSPDLFDAPHQSVNFLACHDGFTLHDVVAYDRKHNEANGEGNRDGAHDDRSWNCGWEGEIGAPADVLALRRRQLRYAWALLLLSHGVPMWSAGDEFGRTQGGNNNAYNQDNETSWVDWARRPAYLDLERFVAALLAWRHHEPVFAAPGFWRDAIRWYGARGPVDTSPSSRSLAWQVGELYVMANSWWEPLDFDVQAPGPWVRIVDTALPAPDDIVPVTDLATAPPVADRYPLAPRSLVVLHRP